MSVFTIAKRRILSPALKGERAGGIPKLFRDRRS